MNFEGKKYENGIKILRCPFNEMHFKIEDIAPNAVLIDCELALVYVKLFSYCLDNEKQTSHYVNQLLMTQFIGTTLRKFWHSEQFWQVIT